MNWTAKDSCFDKQLVTTNGNKYMLGNGYMGYRGTLEEFSKTELAAVTLVYMTEQETNGENPLMPLMDC